VRSMHSAWALSWALHESTYMRRSSLPEGNKPKYRTTAAASALAWSAAGLTALSSPAHAQPTAPDPSATAAFDVTEGEASWGVKESFRNYIRGPIAGGSWDVDGAIADEAGVVTWSDGAGTIDDADSLSGSISYTGGVHYTGHEG